MNEGTREGKKRKGKEREEKEKEKEKEKSEGGVKATEDAEREEEGGLDFVVRG